MATVASRGKSALDGWDKQNYAFLLRRTRRHIFLGGTELQRPPAKSE